MGSIIPLALAAAVYPQLLAVVVVILSRPGPRALLWGCYVACLAVSVSASVLLFAVFRSRGSVAGTSSSRLGPGAYMAAGAIAVAIAILIAAPRGRRLLLQNRTLSFPSRRSRRGHASAMARARGRAERSLNEGSLVVAVLVGGLLAVPGPFDLLALGSLARSGYGVLAAGGAMFVFALVKFVLIEVPIAGYVIDPDGTAAQVSRFARWAQSNKLVGVAAITGLFGAVLIVRGISGLG